MFPSSDPALYRAVMGSARESLPTLRERAIQAARASLCVHHFTDGFCGGEKADCRHCQRLGAQVALDVLRRIRPTLKRLLTEAVATKPLTVDDVLILIDEAT